jgi:hypothetical protein
LAECSDDGHGDGVGIDAADGPFFSHQSQDGGVFEVMPVLVQ